MTLRLTVCLPVPLLYITLTRTQENCTTQNFEEVDVYFLEHVMYRPIMLSCARKVFLCL